MNLPQIEDQIRIKLTEVSKQILPGEGDKSWTDAIKLSIGQLGESIGYHVCTSGLPEHFDEGEWLYDLCWYKKTSENQLLEMTLALESEWKWPYVDIKYDFEKLLVGKAKLKVMLFQVGGNDATEYMDRLERGIRTYLGGSAGEIYLLACFNNDPALRGFTFRRIEGV